MAVSFTLNRLLTRKAEQHPERAAVVFEERTLTHYEMLAQARRAGSALGRDLARQSRVAILAQNCPEYLEVMGGAHLAALILVTLNWRLTVPELAKILRDCEPDVIVFESQYANQAAELRGQGITARWVVIGAGPKWAIDYERALRSVDPGGHVAEALPDDVAALIYTSGTTGQPKGVVLTHSGLYAGALTNCSFAAAQTEDRVLISMPLYHIGAIIMYLAYSTVGATIVLHRAFNADATARAIVVDGVTHLHIAPTMLGRIIDAVDARGVDTSALTNIIYSSSPMPAPLLRRGIDRFGSIFTQIYGMTEYVSATVLRPFQHVLEGSSAATGRLASAGQPYLDCDVRILADDGRECTPGAVGEVALSGPPMMRGYWNNEAQTRKVLRDGWFLTGDLGFVDREGFLFLVDRKKDMIVSGGENIYSREVEEALASHPEVLQASVIGVPDLEWGESVKAFVVLAPDSEVGAENLIAYSRTLIASYKKPRTVEFVSALPLLPSGKVDKKALRAPYWADRDRQI